MWYVVYDASISDSDIFLSVTDNLGLENLVKINLWLSSD